MMGALATSREHLETDTSTLRSRSRLEISGETVYAGRSAGIPGSHRLAIWGYPDTALRAEPRSVILRPGVSLILSPIDHCSRMPTPGFNCLLGDARKMLKRAEEMLALATDHPHGLLDADLEVLCEVRPWPPKDQFEEGIAELQARQTSTRQHSTLPTTHRTVLRWRRPT